MSVSGVNSKSLVDKFGRYICPLTRLTLNYCRVGGGSRWMREYINNGVKKFAEENPEVAIHVWPRNNRAPRLVANYLGGHSKVVSVKKLEPPEIEIWIKRLRAESGKPWEKERLRKNVLTDKPSIQRTWDPFMHKPLPTLPAEKTL